MNACERLYPVFEAELLSEASVQDEDMQDAVQVVNGEFVWDGPPPDAPGKDKKGKKGSKKDAPKDAPPPAAEPQSQESTFRLRDVNLAIPKGQLTAIVGTCFSHSVSDVAQGSDRSRYRSCRLRQVVFASGSHRGDAPDRRHR